MCEQNDMNTIGDVAAQLREGLPIVKNVPEEGLVVYKSTKESLNTEPLLNFFEQSIWDSVAPVWQINASAKPKTASVQMKLM